jgi:hypothetical protein
MPPQALPASMHTLAMHGACAQGRLDTPITGFICALCTLKRLMMSLESGDCRLILAATCSNGRDGFMEKFKLCRPGIDLTSVQ